MIEVKVKKGEPVERALRRLKKKMSREGVLREVRERRYKEKPSKKKYRKMQRAKYAAKMQSLRESFEYGNYRPPKNSKQDFFS